MVKCGLRFLTTGPSPIWLLKFSQIFEEKIKSGKPKVLILYIYVNVSCSVFAYSC